ncbi:MAG TPA: hypothetical protein VI485_25080 [Vicinamibacterales bacterium]|nr:hypothetical protein [Vicinamibacterales bacterium]
MLDLTGLEGRFDIAFDVPTEDYFSMLIRSAVNAGIPLPPRRWPASTARQSSQCRMG